MGLYQNSVIKKYLKGIETNKVNEAWEKFTAHFHNKTIQENIRNSKEEQYQGEFLIDLFVNVFGYTKNPIPHFNLTTELKNVRGAKKTDGAILKDEKALAVIELKGTNITDLAKVENQAFGYKNNQPGCVYVITSNFEKLRFYIDNAVDFEEFNLFQITKERFEILWLCLSSEYLLKNTPKQIKDESLTQEENVTKKLYKDYSLFRNEIFDSIQKNNPNYDKLTLFKKTQKLLDRFLFIFFAEDRLLLPPNSIREIINQWTTLRDELDAYVPLYNRFKKYFGYMNTGYKGKRHDIFAYNGGLFASDEILDNIKIDDDILYKHTQNLSNYDFESEVSVNILGHIFEHSLNEIEEIQAGIEGIETDKRKSKRKKDGVFYTPKYITKYIVDNTVGKLCEEKKKDLGVDEAEYEKDRKGRKKATLKALIQKLEDYRNWLLELTICDPACGSGAFLNQALEFLISEHRYIDELNSKVLGEAMILSDIENSILENNLFGVDINEESVEIAKLSLWLRTAKKGRKLTSLNDNIKCGNSLIDAPEVAGDKTFNWQIEFSEIFESGGFDIIIGNPPYKAGRHWSDKDSELHNYLTEEYETADYQLDLYVLFFERSLQILKKNQGLLSFIAPNTWFTNISSKGMRKYFLTKSKIIQILDCSKVDVFKDAVVETSVVTMKSSDNKTNKVEILQLKGNEMIHLHTIDGKNWIHDSNYYMNIYVSEDEQRIKSKIEKLGVPLGDFCIAKFGVKIYQVGKGKPKQTKDIGTNRVFETNSKLSDDYYKMLEGKDVNRYNITWKGRWLKYGIHLAEPRNLEMFTGQRFLVRRIMGKRIIACSTEEPMISNALLHVVKVPNKYSAKVVLGIVCSSLMAFYFKKSSGREDKAFPEIKVHQLRSLPIICSDKSMIIESPVNQLLKENDKLYALKHKFINYLQSEITIEKPSRKILNWDELSFSDFIKELNKFIRKSGGDKLSKLEEMDWMEIFEAKQNDVQVIKSSIEIKDKELDQMVYELYSLTDNEIRIVKESTA